MQGVFHMNSMRYPMSPFPSEVSIARPFAMFPRYTQPSLMPSSGYDEIVVDRLIEALGGAYSLTGNVEA
jgi:hypothetical protein